MSEEQTIQAPPPADIPAAAPIPAAPSDPFSLDENALTSLTPEQRAGLDPVIESWKKRATEEISKRESSVAEKYKPLEEKASALDKLINYQPFVQWWQAQQRTAQAGQGVQQQQQIQQSQPQQFASPQEWQEAILDASNGDATKMQQIQARMMASWAQPLVQKIQSDQQALRTEMELKNLFEVHPNAKDLDKIGLNDKGEGVSLLEQALDWAERNGRTLEEGYRLADQWFNSMKTSAQQQAMGMVNDKKGVVTAGPSTQSQTKNVVEVGSMDELMMKSMDAQLRGDKETRFVVKSSK
jgi:hypothetical protein